MPLFSPNAAGSPKKQTDASQTGRLGHPVVALSLQGSIPVLA
jgi:hypothetical protein